MKFIVYGNRFTAEPPSGGEIPIKMLTSRRMLFMKDTAACLLKDVDVWHSFEEYTQNMDAALRQDLADALTLLCCFDLAEEEQTREAAGPCRVAGERDYRALAAFIQANMGQGLSLQPSGNPEYYNEDDLRYRQFNNHEYNFLMEAEGKIIATMNVAVPGLNDVSNAAFFQSVVFAKELPEDRCREIFRELVDFISAAFRGDLNKFRFALCSCGDAPLYALLPEMGFSRTAVFKKEADADTDLLLYDRMI